MPLVSLLAIVFFVVILWGILGSSHVLHQPRCILSITPDHYELPWKQIEVHSKDGTLIKGWFIPHSAPQGLLFLLHGFGTCKADLLDIAQAFHVFGHYHLAMIDLRGHGDSGGKEVSFGRHEVDDVQTIINFLRCDSAIKNLPIGFYGVSMGGAISICAAAHLQHIKAVVTDSTYSDLDKIIARTLRRSYYIPRFPLADIIIWTTALRLRCRLRNLNPSYLIKKIAPCAVFIIHGMADRTTPFMDAQTLFESAQEPKKLWLVPEAEHVASFYKNRELYTLEVLNFYQNAFK